MPGKKKPAKARKSRAEWLEAAEEMMAEGGVSAVRVEVLARKLGVTKGSFYWHFTSRDELLGALLDDWEAVGTRAIITSVESTDGTPRERLRALWDTAARSGAHSLAVELAIRDWGRRDRDVRELIQRVDAQRMDYLRRLFREAGFTARQAEARSLLVYSLLIGDYFIDVKHRAMSRNQVLSECLALLSSA